MLDENPYAAPLSDVLGKDFIPKDAEVAWRDGEMLKCRKGATLPDRCINCNAPAEGYGFTRKLSWASPMWLLVLLISPILFVIVYLIVSRRGKLTVGLCPLHRKRRGRAIGLGWLAALAGIAAIIGGIMLEGNSLQVVLILAGVFVLIAGILGGAIGSRVFVLGRIDKEFIWLKKAAAEYAATFPRWGY